MCDTQPTMKPRRHDEHRDEVAFQEPQTRTGRSGLPVRRRIRMTRSAYRPDRSQGHS